MLRIAVPNKGSLSEPASAMLHEAGYQQRKDRKELVLVDSANEVEFFFLRPRDIAVYVGSGQLHIGITGRDLLLDSGASAEEIMQLGFAGSTFRYATRPGVAADVRDFTGMTIATSFPGLVTRHLEEHGVDASVVRLDGAVETSIQLGVAQVIADVVETGTTLRNAGLEIIGEPILHSEAVVVRGTDAPADGPKVQQFLRRIQGVLVARSYVMMDYDIRAEAVEHAVALTPGLESPTVAPLHDPGWMAVRAMVPTQDAQRVMDDLYEVGARAILTTGIHACRVSGPGGGGGPPAAPGPYAPDPSGPPHTPQRTDAVSDPAAPEPSPEHSADPAPERAVEPPTDPATDADPATDTDPAPADPAPAGPIPAQPAPADSAPPTPAETGPPAGQRPDLPELPITFRPTRTRVVLITCGVVLFALISAIILMLPMLNASDRTYFVLTALVFLGVPLLLSRPKVTADRGGVTVVNLTARRHLEWAEILGVNLRVGDPWVFLDLADGTSLPALGIQPGIAKAQAIRDARTLRALVEAYGSTDDRP